MSEKIISISLNRYMVEMVKPKRCIRGRMYFLDKHHPSDICNDCFLCTENKCEYETVVVDLAKGEFETNYDKPRDWTFEQFCCPHCGELIKQEDTRTITWADIKCKHCNTEYVCIEDDFKNSTLVLARRPEIK